MYINIVYWMLPNLQAQFPGRLLEKVVLVSFQAGYIFIQTDKTLHSPNSHGESKLRRRWESTRENCSIQRMRCAEANKLKWRQSMRRALPHLKALAVLPGCRMWPQKHSILENLELKFKCTMVWVVTVVVVFSFHRYPYELSDRTWIEYWPTEDECEMDKHVSTCTGIDELCKHLCFDCVPSWNLKTWKCWF